MQFQFFGFRNPALFWVLGALMFPLNPEEQSPMSKNDGQSSQLVRTDGVSHAGLVDDFWI